MIQDPVKQFLDELNRIKKNPKLLKEFKKSDEVKALEARHPFINPEVDKNLFCPEEYGYLLEQGLAPVGIILWRAICHKHNRESLYITMKLLISVMKRETPDSRPIGWLSSKSVATTPGTDPPSDRTIRRHLRELEDIGLIIKVEDYRPNMKCALYAATDWLLRILENEEDKWVGLSFVDPRGRRFWHTTTAPVYEDEE